MTDFQNDISERSDWLTQAGQMQRKRDQFTKVYARALSDAEGNQVTVINDFQVAFLDLVNEKYPALSGQMQEPLKERFYEMYGHSADESERQYSAEKELTMHSIQLPSPVSDNWQIMYEMKNDETVFHVCFEGWTYQSIGITH